jgi:hypothetical protein
VADICGKDTIRVLASEVAALGARIALAARSPNLVALYSVSIPFYA